MHAIPRRLGTIDVTALAAQIIACGSEVWMFDDSGDIPLLRRPAAPEEVQRWGYILLDPPLTPVVRRLSRCLCQTVAPGDFQRLDMVKLAAGRGIFDAAEPEEACVHVPILTNSRQMPQGEVFDLSEFKEVPHAPHGEERVHLVAIWRLHALY